MRTTFAAALLAASVLAAPAFAQSTIVPMPQAPAATVKSPPTGSVVSPLTAHDQQFVRAALEGNMAEIQAAQLALKVSQDQNVRDYAQKMITDHTAANETLMPIASRHSIQEPTMLTPRHQAMLERLSKLSGESFNTAYIDDMVRTHEAMLKLMNNQLAKGQSQEVNAWVQNTRPTVVQHEQLAEKVKAVLPPTG